MLIRRLGSRAGQRCGIPGEAISYAILGGGITVVHSRGDILLLTLGRLAHTALRDVIGAGRLP